MDSLQNNRWALADLDSAKALATERFNQKNGGACWKTLKNHSTSRRIADKTGLISEHPL